MKFFRELYGNADEDMKRAMIKSYQESGKLRVIPGLREPKGLYQGSGKL